MTLSTFYSDELQGTMPGHSINITCGMGEGDIMKSVVAGKEDDGIEYGLHGLEAGGLPGSGFGSVKTTEEATEWLLRRKYAPLEDEKASSEERLYLRFWPFDIHEDDNWCEYTGGGTEFNDLNQVGILEGSWFADDKRGREELQKVVAELHQEYGLLTNG